MWGVENQLWASAPHRRREATGSPGTPDRTGRHTHQLGTGVCRLLPGLQQLLPGVSRPQGATAGNLAGRGRVRITPPLADPPGSHFPLSKTSFKNQSPTANPPPWGGGPSLWPRSQKSPDIKRQRRIPPKFLARPFATSKFCLTPAGGPQSVTLGGGMVRTPPLPNYPNNDTTLISHAPSNSPKWAKNILSRHRIHSTKG